ncbi:hypothetical protein JTB14_015356 [Gonioctena quinquepunctata]|nr:hypothetical protein JTB14_015356 [Gonioctena quinquepunctata]
MEIRHVAESLNLDVLLLQEPYSYKDKRSQWEIPGMRQYRVAANSKIKPMSSIIIINPDIDVIRLARSESNLIETVSIKRNNREVIINSIYCPPDDDDEIHKLIDRITIGINKISNQVAGKIRPKRKYSPWWSEELTDSKRIVKQERRKYQDSKRLRQSEDNINQKRANYRDALSSYKTNFKESKDDLWRRFIEDDLSTNPWGVIYKLATDKINADTMFTAMNPEAGENASAIEDTLSYVMNALMPDDDINTDCEVNQEIRTGEAKYVGVVKPPT